MCALAAFAYLADRGGSCECDVVMSSGLAESADRTG
jgi:hypothetical protein